MRNVEVSSHYTSAIAQAILTRNGPFALVVVESMFFRVKTASLEENYF